MEVNAKDLAEKAFQEKANQFLEEVTKLQEKYKLELYAANVLLNNGEVVPLIRIKGNAYEDNTSRGAVSDKKTQADTVKS